MKKSISVLLLLGMAAALFACKTGDEQVMSIESNLSKTKVEETSETTVITPQEPIPALNPEVTSEPTAEPTPEPTATALALTYRGDVWHG